MEEPKAPVAVAATQHTLHTQTPTTRKRPLDSNSNSNSNYFKIRALVRDLRPHFIQFDVENNNNVDSMLGREIGVRESEGGGWINTLFLTSGYSVNLLDIACKKNQSLDEGWEMWFHVLLLGLGFKLLECVVRSTNYTSSGPSKIPLDFFNLEGRDEFCRKEKCGAADLVLQTPDYKNCKASHEIRDQLKIVLKVYDDMKADVVSLKQQPQRFKSPEQTQVEKAFARPSVGEDSQTSGTYVIGGSAFGWNFITFSAMDSVYYGRTKEQFRLQKKTE
ncbi:hypothetical protein TSUD_159570 [Trifolium subterraneum]|uniref:Uncharacterized protein n=1 Tax=Trifolium subterraneum TaxID=3900 RepID=A0A2Z6MY62_TRISU|nr:hypothetical protein TSUD_159570 [Trifolium subterraneum]